MAGEFKMVGDVESPHGCPESLAGSEEGSQEVILLDTHTLIWLADEPAQLSEAAMNAIRRSGQEGSLAISAIPLREVAWLATHGRLEVLGTVQAFVRKIASRTEINRVALQIAVLACQLPENYPGDPCDRLIGGHGAGGGYKPPYQEPQHLKLQAD